MFNNLKYILSRTPDIFVGHLHQNLIKSRLGNSTTIIAKYILNTSSRPKHNLTNYQKIICINHPNIFYRLENYFNKFNNGLTIYKSLKSNSRSWKQYYWFRNLLPNIFVKYGRWKGQENRFFYPIFGFSIFGLKFWEEEKEEEEEEDQLVMMIKRGILATQREQLAKAEQLFHLALKTAQERQNEEAVTYIFDMMANLAYHKKDYPKAEKLFKSVLHRMLLDGKPEDDNAVVSISLKLANIYANYGDRDKAESGYVFCIGTQDKKIKEVGEKNLDEDTMLLWAMSMDHYARYLVSLKNYDLAKKHFIRAHEICQNINGPNHEQSAVLLNDIGSVCVLQNKFDEGIQYIQKAIDIAAEVDGEDLSTYYINLGSVQIRMNLYEEGTKACTKGGKLAKDKNNEDGIQESKICLKLLEEMQRRDNVIKT